MCDGLPHVRSRLAQFAALGVVGGCAAWLLLVVFDQSVRPWLVIALGTSGALLAVAVVLAFERRPDPVIPPRGDARDEAPAASTRYTAELEGLEGRVDAAMSDPQRFQRILAPMLTDLAVQRLRTRRNLDVRSDDARQLLGDDLWRMTISSAPLPTVPTREHLTEWIGRIEAI